MKNPAPSSTNHIRHFSYVRVLGLTLVLIYHFYPKFLPGGFFGVDVFFVFSGYLITSLALEEYRKSKKFSLKKFAERRFFRIFPTVAFAMLITLPFTLFGTADLRYQLKEQVFAGLGFFTNFYEMSTGQAYDNAFAPHIWVHLWSLALEVQFYVVWGLAIWLIAKIFKGALRGLSFLLSGLMFVVIALMMITSAMATRDLSAVYYDFFTHSFPFFAGALLASLMGIHSNKLMHTLVRKWSLKRLTISAVVCVALLVLCAFIFQFSWTITYEIGFLLVSLLTMALIFFLRLVHESTPTKEPRIIAIIADISYGVYIFHWPFLIIFQKYKWSYNQVVIGTLLLSISLSALMFYIIDPILRGRRKLLNWRRWLVPALFAILVIPSTVAVVMSTSTTTLTQSLVEGSYTQTQETLNLTDKYVETGVIGKNILVIGDSVTVGVTTYPNRAGYENISAEIPDAVVDAEGDKKISSDLMTGLNSYLPLMPANTTIVIALGTNSTEPETDIQILKSVISKYSKTHKIVLVTPGNLNLGNSAYGNTEKIVNWELSIQGKYRNVAIANWYAALKGHSDYVDSDGIHLADRPLGRAAWLKTVSSALQSLRVKL